MKQRMRELVVVPVFVVASATKKIELRGICSENMQHHTLTKF
jgi:hypothetical protein